MTTIKQHLNMMDSSSYCPACGASKLIDKDYCLDCHLQSEDIVITAIPNYTVGYTSEVTTWTP